eukprot:gene9715-11515_t
MGPKSKKAATPKSPAPERSMVRHNYQEIFEAHLVELKKEAKLSDCWFGENPRGNENDGEAVRESYAQHGKLRDEPPMLWAKLPAERPGHYAHIPK